MNRRGALKKAFGSLGVLALTPVTAAANAISNEEKPLTAQYLQVYGGTINGGIQVQGRATVESVMIQGCETGIKVTECKCRGRREP